MRILSCPITRHGHGWPPPSPLTLTINITLPHNESMKTTNTCLRRPSFWGIDRSSQPPMACPWLDSLFLFPVSLVVVRSPFPHSSRARSPFALPPFRRITNPSSDLRRRPLQVPSDSARCSALLCLISLPRYFFCFFFFLLPFTPISEKKTLFFGCCAALKLIFSGS